MNWKKVQYSLLQCLNFTENTEENKLLNKVAIFVCFFVFRCFIKFRLNHCSHMDYFNNVFTTFLGLEW